MAGEYDDVGGVFELKVNGRLYNLKGAPTIELGGMVRTPVLGNDGRLHGYKAVANNPGKISGTITDTNALDLVELQQIKNATVTVKKPNGKTVVLKNATFSIVARENGDEGEVSFEFQGPPAKEQMS